MRRVVAVGLALSGVMVCDCQGKGLTRQRAKTLIEADMRFRSASPSVSVLAGSEEEAAGNRAGIWHRGRVWDIVLTQYGSTLFRPSSARNPLGGSFDLVQARSPRIVDVTGIADAGGLAVGIGGAAVKEVQFSWAYPDLPAWLHPTATPQTGKALLRLYDDGWRVEDLEIADRALAIEFDRLPTAPSHEGAKGVARTGTTKLARYRFPGQRSVMTLEVWDIQLILTSERGGYTTVTPVGWWELTGPVQCSGTQMSIWKTGTPPSLAFSSLPDDEDMLREACDQVNAQYSDWRTTHPNTR